MRQSTAVYSDFFDFQASAIYEQIYGPGKGLMNKMSNLITHSLKKSNSIGGIVGSTNVMANNILSKFRKFSDIIS